MKKRVVGILLVVLLIASGTAYAEKSGGLFDKENFGATIYLTTDYVSRGISVSNQRPALQGTLDYFHPTGVFLGIWASSWHSAEASNDLELGYYAGYYRELGNFAFSLSANYYDYPGADDEAAEWNYWEFCATAGYTFDQIALSPTLGIGYTFSPDYWGEDGKLHYTNATVDLVLPYNLGLGLEGGYFDLEGGKTTGNRLGLNGGDGYSYYHWRVGVSTTLVGFGLDLSYHNTTERAFFDNLGGDRVVFTISRSI
jgi:uncharacterized protein (TIGR02001 family)